MQMFITIILLVVGFVLLIKGADFFVDGSSSLAREFHIPGLVIGMTIVAMGTSLPELSVVGHFFYCGTQSACSQQCNRFKYF